jgi:hypothetical protein
VVEERVYGDGREVDEIKCSREASGWRGMRVEDCAAAGGGPEKLSCCWGAVFGRRAHAKALSRE